MAASTATTCDGCGRPIETSRHYPQGHHFHPSCAPETWYRNAEERDRFMHRVLVAGMAAEAERRGSDDWGVQ